MMLFVFSEMPEYFSDLLAINNERVQLKDQIKVVPSLIDNLWVVLLLSDRKIASFEKEIEKTS